MAASSDHDGKLYGELVPEGGGDPIPLRSKQLVLGRREDCDIVLRFGNVSSHHCELTLESGYWFVRDLNSRNGTRLNGYRVNKKRMDPGDKLSVAHHDYRAKYSPAELGAEGPPPDVDVMEEIMSRSLMDGAGLNRKQRQAADGRIGVQRNKLDPLEQPAAGAQSDDESASDSDESDQDDLNDETTDDSETT